MEDYRFKKFFWERLLLALENLPDNPKPNCKGFYSAEYCKVNKIMTVEKIGFVPAEKDFKYLHLAAKKATQTLLFGKVRSKEFENSDLEQYAGGVNIYEGSNGTSGHDAIIDEAISAIRLTTIHLFKEEGWELGPSDFIDNTFTETSFFLHLLVIKAGATMDKFMPDNKWVIKIALLMEDPNCFK